MRQWSSNHAMRNGRSSLRARRLGASTLVCIAGLQRVVVVQAGEPSFGPHDIPTLFFIEKSDDRNRVDYGMRLDEHCAPAKADAVFPYWREFEHAPPVRTHSLGMFEYLGYGISAQRTLSRTSASGEHVIRLKQVDRLIWITTSKRSDGRCSALVRSTIAAVPYAQLLSIYVKLSGPLSVAYVDVKGKNLRTAQRIEERIKR
jgi:hypothetical protein